MPFCSYRDALSDDMFVCRNRSVQFLVEKLTPWTIVRRLIKINSLHTPNSSLEGAVELKFVPFCSYRDALSDDMFVCRNRSVQFLVENLTPWSNVRRFDQNLCALIQYA